MQLVGKSLFYSEDDPKFSPINDVIQSKFKIFSPESSGFSFIFLFIVFVKRSNTRTNSCQLIICNLKLSKQYQKLTESKANKSY